MSSANNAEALEGEGPESRFFDAHGGPISPEGLPPDARWLLRVVEAMHRYGIDDALGHETAGDSHPRSTTSAPTINVNLR